ncbi:hypothetical protein HO133_003587 [Letharia lupina]|uniref:Inhibitor I9 domain-containing protein n=1 Tax=Letharia lupina TaxID=560253 RepID=A0A8H6CA63_9LECA|nr:uncharacterized protein HO133_003587 [Letharia lupina]KAF6219762.1 hypothetical protein HO133_003587 [Letharia lupina]
MKIQVLLALLALGVNGLAPQQQYLITYPKDAPQSDIDDYKHTIMAAGGQILHEYELIKGFVVKASAPALDTIHTLSQKYAPTIEEDKTVTIQDQGL